LAEGFFLLIAHLAAQSQTLNQIPSGTALLTEGWRYKVGDNAGWAEPGFAMPAAEPLSALKHLDWFASERLLRTLIELPITEK